MLKEVVVPEIGENVESGEVVNVMVEPGAKVSVDQSLLELETDKAVVEIPSPFAGKVAEILVKAGDTVKIGQAFAKIDAGEETTAADAEEKSVPTEKEPEEKTAAQEKQPKPMPTSVPDDGPRPDAAPEPKTRQGEPPRSEKAVAAPPSVRRLARELGVSVDDVTGSGPGGRISAEDVKQYAKSLLSGGKDATSDAADFDRQGATERVPLSNVRKITAAAMSESWRTVPHVTQYDRADVTELEDYRKEYGPEVEAAGGKLTVTSVLLKVTAAALKVFPQFNASLDAERDELILKKYYHIGVAVDTERGLLVPVVRDVDRKNIVQLSVELSELAQRTRDKKIKPDELHGGNFTISNLGGIGGTIFSPIVYAPQVAIIGVGRATMEPKYIDSEFRPRLMLPLALSYDHRVIDGADGARFLRWVCEAMEEPFLLALSG